MRSVRSQLCPQNWVALACITILVKALIIFLSVWLTNCCTGKASVDKLSNVFASVLQEHLLCCFFACVWTPLSFVTLLFFSAVCSFKSNSKPPNSLYSFHCYCNTNRNWSTISIWSCVSHIMESVFKHTSFSPSKLVLKSILSCFQLKYHNRCIYKVPRISQ